MTLPYPADGPDCVEGAVAEINRRTALDGNTVETISRDDLIDSSNRM